MRPLTLVFVFFLSARAGAAPFKTISRLSEITSPDQSGTVIALDLDETVMKPAGEFGSRAWYDALVSRIQKHRHLDDERAHARAMRIWNQAQTTLEVKPLDPGVSTWVSERRQQRIAVIGLTARRPTIARATFRQLQSLKIRLSRVLFVGEHRPKGPALLEFLEKGPQPVRKVVFVDDQVANLDSVRATLEAAGIPTELYRFVGSPCQSLLEANP